MAKVKVRVPFTGPEIRIAHQGDEPTVYKVTDGHVSVDETDARMFLNTVAGSELVGGEKAADKLPDA